MLSPGRQGKTLIWYSENLRTAGFGKPHHEHTFCGPLCCECGVRVERSHRSDLLRTRTFENQSGDLVNRNSRKEIRQKKMEENQASQAREGLLSSSVGRTLLLALTALHSWPVLRRGQQAPSGKLLLLAQSPLSSILSRCHLGGGLNA